MKLTLSPFASRIRSPGLSRPCLSMNESMMILATITWVHFLKNSFSKKQKSEAYHLHDIICCILHNQKIFLFLLMDSAQQVGFSNTGSGRVWGKIPGSGSDLGRVWVLKYTIRYFRVFLYSWVFPGIFGYLFTRGYSWVFWVYKISSLFLEAESWILRFPSFIYWGYSFKEPPTTNKDCRDLILYLKYPVMSGNNRNIGFTQNIA